MSQTRYGIRRFALLNTAGYSLGIFPLENPLSIYGANNLGKSASINALQFPILARLSDMSFGKYSMEQSRRFYFASDTSYILLELMLPHGPHVIGVAGRGPGGGFGHQFFAYAGELSLDHYQKNGTCLRQRELFANLEREGFKAYEVKPEELRRLLVGGHTSIPLDLTMIPLRSTSEQSLKTFRSLFINLLHMREITAAKLKQLFLDAFEHSLRSGNVDYIAACEEAFRDVRRMEQDYQALVAAGPLVEALANGVTQRDVLRGKMHRLSPLLDSLLGTWHDYAGARREELLIQHEQYRAEQDGLQNEQRGGTQELMRLEREIAGIQRWLGELSVLKTRFALVDDAKVLEQQLLAAKDAHDELAGALAHSRQFSSEDLEERLRDLEKRVLRVLLGDTAPLRVPAGAIVAAREITPSDLAPLVDAGAAGLCMAEGGATSHVAILARSKGLPCLVALGTGLLELEEGRQVVLDAGQGRLELSPDARRLEQVALQVAQREEQHRRQQADAQREALTRDGRRIEIGANVASPREAAEAFANGADGVGLLRTEFLFLERRAAPDEEEQRNAYQEVLDAMGQRKVIIRTIDVGGDKHLDYLPLPVEENPALGLRGIRLGQARPELLDQQLRALLRVEPLERCRILLPMVSEVDELRAIRRRLGELATQLGIERLPELGVMIEVPSAALLADQLAEHADFLSIGTNDLSQYALAMDRCHAGLADRIDALHPALLRLIAQTCAGAARHGRWVGVCGALASDPLATPVLVGLGVEELSVGPNLVGEIKTRVRQLDAAECRRHAQALLDLGSARAVRDACLQHWPLA